MPCALLAVYRSLTCLEIIKSDHIIKENLLTDQQDHASLISFSPHQYSLTRGVLFVQMPEIKEKDLRRSLWISKNVQFNVNSDCHIFTIIFKENYV